MVLDYHLADLVIAGVRRLVLEQGQGFMELGQLAVNQELCFKGVRVLFIITGFAEVEADHPALGSCVLAALQKVISNADFQKIFLGAPAPTVCASKEQLRRLFQLTKQLQWFCKHNPKFEYTKTGLLLYGPGGVYANLMTSEGLTHAGVNALNTQTLDKLASCRVRVASR